MRAIINFSIKQKRRTYITFYDVKKAFDHVDVDDMLVTMWEKGLRGKIWRILKNLNQNLKTSITRPIRPTMRPHDDEMIV